MKAPPKPNGPTGLRRDRVSSGFMPALKVHSQVWSHGLLPDDARAFFPMRVVAQRPRFRLQSILKPPIEPVVRSGAPGWTGNPLSIRNCGDLIAEPDLRFQYSQSFSLPPHQFSLTTGFLPCLYPSSDDPPVALGRAGNRIAKVPLSWKQRFACHCY